MSRLKNAAMTGLAATGVLAAAVIGHAAVASAAARPPAAAGTHACGNDAIAVTATRPQGATGHGNVVLEFQNISGVRCSLRGYPGLDAIGKRGHVLAHAKRTKTGFTGGTKHIRTVVLRPDRFASADVEWMNFAPNGGDCTFSKSVNATPANTGYTVHLARSVSLCGLQVHPTVKGRSGNGS
jgi:hypothetical protein